MLPVIELFKSIQGEGKYTGYPSVFIRVTGCNLRCVFNGSLCDTPYTSHKPEKAKYNLSDAEAFVKENTGIQHIVITGGEPLLYQSGINTLIGKIFAIYEEYNRQHKTVLQPVITIETNGSLPIDFENHPNLKKVTLWSISPKLSSSVPTEKDGVSKELIARHKTERYSRDIFLKNIKGISAASAGIQLKFVYTGIGCVDEIKKDYVHPIYESCGTDKTRKQPYLPQFNVLLMPEGTSQPKLHKNTDEIITVCQNEEWVYCTRLHVTLFGDERNR